MNGLPDADLYSIIKTLHVVSATILFGTGIGTVFFFWSSRHSDDAARLFAAKTTVRADCLFTLPAVIVQPVTGVWMIVRGGYDASSPWLIASYFLYMLAGACWLPVVVLQIRMKCALQHKVDGGTFDEVAFQRMRKIWFALGWPAFIGLLIVFFLMVTKPSW